MRNIRSNPPTKQEILDCLRIIAASVDPRRTDQIGDMRPLLLELAIQCVNNGLDVYTNSWKEPVLLSEPLPDFLRLLYQAHASNVDVDDFDLDTTDKKSVDEWNKICDRAKVDTLALIDLVMEHHAALETLLGRMPKNE